MKPRKFVIAVAALIVLVAVGYSYLGGHATPATQKPLSDLNAESLDAFRIQFNNASDRTRIVLLLSPT